MKIPTVLLESKFGSRKMFIIFLIVIIVQVTDAIIGNLSDILKDFTISFAGVSLFIGMTLVYCFGQNFILRMVSAKNKEKEIKRIHFNILENIVTVVQYILTLIIILVILQVIFESQYYRLLLNIGVVVSGGLALFVMSLLSYHLLSWFRANRAPVVLLYGMAAAMIAVSVVAMIVLFNSILLEKATVISPKSEVIFPANIPGTIITLANSVQTISGIISFLLFWAGTILLLYHNVHRIGKIKFWVLVSTPLVFFSSFYVSFYQSIAGTVSTEDAVSTIVIPLLLIIISGVMAATLIGIAFASVGRALSPAILIRDYLMITAFGFILFFTTTLTSLAGSGFPPFGFVNVLLVGPFSFLVLNGLYRSAICVSEDVKLRQTVRKLAKKESQLLESTASAENLREVKRKVMTAVKATAESLALETGVESSLTETEIQEQIEIVTRELSRKK